MKTSAKLRSEIDTLMAEIEKDTVGWQTTQVKPVAQSALLAGKCAQLADISTCRLVKFSQALVLLSLALLAVAIVQAVIMLR
jgi:hypothetical protein